MLTKSRNHLVTDTICQLLLHRIFQAMLDKCSFAPCYSVYGFNSLHSLIISFYLVTDVARVVVELEFNNLKPTEVSDFLKDVVSDNCKLLYNYTMEEV